MKLALFVGLGVAAALYIAALLSAVLRARTRGDSRVAPSRFELVLGFVACFFDTLGIGSFAPTTAALKLRGLVADETIPGTLNVGYTLPTIAQWARALVSRNGCFESCASATPCSRCRSAAST